MIESSSESSNINQIETSTYASAESSPSLTHSSSSQSLRSNLSLNPDETMKNKLGHSISISSLLGNKNLQSVSLDDPSVVVSATSPKKLPDQGKSVTSSTSTNALDKLFKHHAEFSSEFQSLPHTLIPGGAKQANEIEKNLLNDSFNQKSQGQTLHDFVKNTVTSLIENTVKTSIEEMTKEVREEKEKNLAAKLMPSLFPANTVSSSSPNPTCSPFKFLVDSTNQEPNAPKSPSQQTKIVSTLSPNGSTIQDAVSIFNAEQLKQSSSSVIDKLAHLNHKEHEKEDPVLTTSKNGSDKIEHVKSTSAAPQSMTVPESSQEFCRNLNLNLAAAAANASTVPLVVESCQKKSENQQFTSNASTSSIHNDLKLILEANKPETKEQVKNKEAPKPQREKSNRSKANKSEQIENGENVMKLVSMMKQMAESKGKPGQMVLGDESGKYRYNKEFLQQIRSDRAAFIQNINPEIFKAYCYCMSGRYWDPEKYFDIVQFSGDYERAVHQNQAVKQKKNPKEKKAKIGKSTKVAVDSSKIAKENIMQSLGLNKTNDVKQADKFIMDMLKKNPEQKLDEPSANSKQVDLMDMLGKKPKNSNILGELFSQNSQPKHHPVILTAQELELSQINRPVNRLFAGLNQTPDLASKLKSPNSCGSNSCASECSSTSSDAASNSQAYKQLIKNLSNHPLCTPSSVPARSFENVLMKLQQKKHENSVQNAVSNAQNLAKDGTNLLKQLLHLNTEHSDEKKTRQKKSQHQNKHQKSNKQELITSVESTVTTTTTTTITQTQFPAVNPHEKPFQNVSSKSNQLESLLSKMKQPVQPEAKQQVKNEKEHFNSLLNKITSHSQPVKQPNEPENILKWFSGLNNSQNLSKPNFSVKTLSEIELMSGHFP